MTKRNNVLVEGGTLPDVGAIHIDEIEPTLKPLEQYLQLDLTNNMLGSAGKKEFSGDIDVAVDISTEEMDDFLEKLKKFPGISDVKKSSVIMTKVKIQDYDETKTKDGLERTGYVQVDFMPGELDWMKTFYHAPHEKDSKYKGVFRNILLSSIASHYKREESTETIPDGRPKEIERYLWSPSDGLVRIIRRPAPNKKGDGYTKANTNEIIEGPYKKSDEIAEVLGLNSTDDLYSYETLKSAIDKNYDPELLNAIFSEFSDNHIVKQLGVPTDIINESFGTTVWFRNMMDILL
jgi:hypothetical protein